MTTTTSRSTTHAPRRKFFVASSANNEKPEFIAIAIAIAMYLIKHGYDLVTGGGQRGLMGIIHRLVQGNLYDEKTNPNGSMIHVVTIEKYKHDITNLIYTGEALLMETVNQRKDAMLKMASAMFVLPGGFGTLDEFFNAIEAKRTDQIDIPICIINFDGVFDGIIAQLEICYAENLASPDNLPFVVVTNAEEAIAYMDEYFAA